MTVPKEASSSIHPIKMEDLIQNEELLHKIVRVAQFESELDLGVNPSNKEQAHVNYLTEKDFEYIRRVSVLVEKRLLDSIGYPKPLTR